MKRIYALYKFIYFICLFAYLLTDLWKKTLEHRKTVFLLRMRRNGYIKNGDHSEGLYVRTARSGKTLASSFTYVMRRARLIWHRSRCDEYVTCTLDCAPLQLLLLSLVQLAFHYVASRYIHRRHISLSVAKVIQWGVALLSGMWRFGGQCAKR